MNNIIEGIDISLFENQRFTEEQREYLSNRWLHEVKWFARATRRSRRLYFALGTISIIAASLTSVLSTASAVSSVVEYRWASALLSVVTLVGIGLFSLYKPWENWKLRSLKLEQLKNEGRMFLASVGPYKKMESSDESFELFFTEIQNIVGNYKISYFNKKPYKPENS